MKKADIYLFLAKEKNKLMEEKVKPLQENYKKLVREKALEIIIENGMNTEEMFKSINFVKQKSADIRDSLDYGGGTFCTIESCLQDIEDLEHMITEVANRLDDDKYIEIREARLNANAMRVEIRNQFNQIEAMVKSTSNAKQAARQLKQLGFNTNNIKVEVDPPMVLNLNNDLLGLPQETKA